jgi:hypothetical protein
MMPELSDDELLDALGVDAAPVGAASHTPREERIIAGFEDILRFVETHGRAPQHGEGNDIFERIYAVRLDRLRSLPEVRHLLAAMDTQGLLGEAATPAESAAGDLDDDALLAALGTDALPDGNDITALKHVLSHQERQVADEVANRTPCKDFDQFQPLFERAERELQSGVRQSARFGQDADISTGDFFILGGQMVYVADKGEPTTTPYGRPDARLRVIYSNGTESDLLLRSLQRALYKDDSGRRLTGADEGPLFSGVMEDGDVESGTIYVLRSLSNERYVAEHRELIHKIGVTGGTVETRIANAEHDATYLLASVEIVASYKLSGINRVKLENLLHRIFAPAQLDLTIKDRFGHPVKPREWFLVPLPVIDEAVRRIRDGTITHVTYNPKTAQLGNE